MIAAVVPVPNEEGRLQACLSSLAHAAVHPSLAADRVVIVAVLDRCKDGSAVLAHAGADVVVDVDAGSVGAARAAGSACAIALGARWLAHTDADTTVAPDWLVAQLAERADVVCGTVAVSEWTALGQTMRRRFDARYRDVDGHRHVHGANLGVCASAYLRAGGFAPLRAHEDVDLVSRLERCGAHIAWSARPRVSTSARLRGRAPDGFAHYLRTLATGLALPVLP